MNKYQDIINLNHNIKRQRMLIQNRASIFAPFMALSGYKDIIDENSVDYLLKDEISIDQKEELDNILNSLKINDEIEITYFLSEKDNKGHYYNTFGLIKKIDYFNKMLMMNNMQRIPFKDIIKLKKKDK